MCRTRHRSPVLGAAQSFDTALQSLPAEWQKNLRRHTFLSDSFSAGPRGGRENKRTGQSLDEKRDFGRCCVLLTAVSSGTLVACRGREAQKCGGCGAGGVLMVAGAAEFLVWNAMLTCATCSSSKFA